MKNQKNYCAQNDIYNMIIRLHARHNWTDQARGLFFEMQEWRYAFCFCILCIFWLPGVFVKSHELGYFCLVFHVVMVWRCMALTDGMPINRQLSHPSTILKRTLDTFQCVLVPI